MVFIFNKCFHVPKRVLYTLTRNFCLEITTKKSCSDRHFWLNFKKETLNLQFIVKLRAVGHLLSRKKPAKLDFSLTFTVTYRFT